MEREEIDQEGYGNRDKDVKIADVVVGEICIYASIIRYSMGGRYRAHPNYE